MKENYLDIKNRIRNSEAHSNKKGFQIKNLCAELDISKEFCAQILGQMVEDGRLSRIEKTNGNKGTCTIFKKVDFRPKDYLTTSYRRHSNQELGLVQNIFGIWTHEVCNH